MPATYEALSQGGHEALATEIFTKIKAYLDTHGADSKVSKSGDTMTGSLNLEFEQIDASKTNNGVSSVLYPTTFNILDVGSRIIARVEGVVQSNGNIGSYWYVRNYNTSGGLVAQKGIAMHMNKSGALSYSVSDGEAFATAIGKYARSSIGTLDWGSNNEYLLTKSAIAHWNGCYGGTASNLQYCNRGAFGTIVTKNSGDYLPVTGGTMTGNINWNGSSGFQNGLYWKESGYGDQFKIYPVFSGADDNNALVIAAAAGGAGTTPALTNRFFFRPSGYLDLTNRTRWNTKQEIYNNDVYMILGTSNMVCVRTYNNINAAKPIQAASFQTYSSRLIKKNITDITQDEAKSLLNLRVVDFDYIEQVGGQTNQTGIIAEEALTVYPKCVEIPENYDEDEVKKAIETGDAINAMNVDYTKLIAPLIKLVQLQQKEIDVIRKEKRYETTR